MRLRLLILTPLCALGMVVPAGAQIVTVDQIDFFGVAPVPSESQVKPEVVVARLMSFDANQDGRLTRAELPERMQVLFARADVGRDDALDSADVRRLAAAPVVQTVVRGFQVGHYGFGEDTGFDSRLHIEGAIDDLRLAGDARDNALRIGRIFAESSQIQARADLIATAQTVLTPDQLTSFRAALDPDLNVNIKTSDPVTAERLRATVIRQLRQMRLMRAVDHFQLTPEQRRQLQTALENFTAHRLSEVQRAALLDQLRSTLTDEQQDDLRAALERRPIVKQDVLAAVKM